MEKNRDSDGGKKGEFKRITLRALIAQQKREK